MIPLIVLSNYVIRLGLTRAKTLQTVSRFPREIRRRYAVSKSNGFTLLFQETFWDVVET
jgi:hypothetical protein